MRGWLGMAEDVKSAAGALWRRVIREVRTLPPRYVVLLVFAILLAVPPSGVGVIALGTWRHVYNNRDNLPDLGPFARFEFSTIGHIYDTNDESLATFAREYRLITQYRDIPTIVRDAILATEDKRFFLHSGVDYLTVPRVLAKVGAMPGSRALFPQGGSSITQQLVRGVFLQQQTFQENSHELRNVSVLPRMLSWAIGARNVNMVLRKLEETRLSLWLEHEMGARFGSTRRAKEEIFARYVSFVYMGHGQYGFARAAEYYFDRSLSSFTAADADKAALLAGIMKAPRDYAPTSSRTVRILRRRNQILALMRGEGFLTRDQMTEAAARPLPAFVERASSAFQSSAVVEHVLDELGSVDAGLGVKELQQGQVQVYSTVDARVQRIASDALEHGLARYEARHPRASGLAQGSVVVLSNDDGSVLAEIGGRQVYDGRAASHSDFNRARQARRQPGSTMKPIVYLAAFQRGDFSLETLVPDEPISVPNGDANVQKWISNYDGVFKGPIPIREALAESRNAVAIWVVEQIGIARVLRTATELGVVTPLHPYAATALGASEVTLLELATAYRTIASGVLAQPHVIRRIVRGPGDLFRTGLATATPYDGALALIQEGLRGVVRMPTGTAYALNARAFPIAVMGKTGTTDEFRDALFVGSTYGPRGITVAVWIGFDDNRSLGSRETGGRVALPVFQDLLLKVYGDGIVGPAPVFPKQMEQRITRYLQGDATPVVINASLPVQGMNER